MRNKAEAEQSLFGFVSLYIKLVENSDITAKWKDAFYGEMHTTGVDVGICKQ